MPPSLGEAVVWWGRCLGADGVVVVKREAADVKAR